MIGPLLDKWKRRQDLHLLLKTSTLFVMVHPGLLPMPVPDRIPSLHGRFQLTTPWQRLIVAARRLGYILRYQLNHPFGLAPQSPTNLKSRQFHHYHPPMVQPRRHLRILLSRTHSEGNFRHFRTIRELGSVLKAPGLPLQTDRKQQSLLGHTQQLTTRIRFLISVHRMCRLPRRPRSRARSHLHWLTPKSSVDMAMHPVVLKLKKV